MDLSRGERSNLLTRKRDEGHEETANMLTVGMAVSKVWHSGDTAARQVGKRGDCTPIGNERFAWCSSTESTSRIHCLAWLSQSVECRYVFNERAWEDVAPPKLPNPLPAALNHQSVDSDNPQAWEQGLTDPGIQRSRHRKRGTEGALIGGLLAQGIPSDLVILRDAAGPFHMVDHALGWSPAERVIQRLIPLHEGHEQAVNWVREPLWQLSAASQGYPINPQPAQAEAIRARFEELWRTKTGDATLNQVVKRFGDNPHEWLSVLAKPGMPLHNTLSEQDIRDSVKKRKSSGSTHSEAGRTSRDPFASLKQTCRKHGISFWH